MKGKLVVFGLVFLIMLSVGAMGDKFVSEGETYFSSGQYQFTPEAQRYYPTDSNVTIPIEVYNNKILTNDTLKCNFTLYGYQDSIVEKRAYFEDSSFKVDISKGTIKEDGEYYYRFLCWNESSESADTSDSAGIFKRDIFFTDSPRTRDMTKDMALPLIVGIGFTVFLLFYFAYKQEDNHHILRQVSIFFGMLGLLLIPTAVTGNVFTNTSLFINIVYTYFTIFMVYFVLSLIYVLVTEKFPGVKGRIKR